MNKRKPNNPGVLSRSLLAVACAFALLSTGCNSSNQAEEVASETEANESKPRKLPKLSLHRPKSCDEAVSRMKELVSAIAADGSLPTPLKYKVREVIHGSGRSAHSHFYRIDENGNQTEPEDDDDHEGESSEKHHEVEVDPYTELFDIAQWLPRIAGDADIDEATWKEVRSTSIEFANALRTIRDESSEDKRRELFRSGHGGFKDWLEKLDSSLAVAAQATESKPESGKAE